MVVAITNDHKEKSMNTTQYILEKLRNNNGMQTGIELLRSAETDGMDSELIVDTVRILVAIGIVTEIVLAGDDIRGDRVFQLKYGFLDDLQIVEKNIDTEITSCQENIDTTLNRIENLEEIVKSKKKLPLKASKSILESIVNPNDLESVRGIAGYDTLQSQPLKR